MKEKVKSDDTVETFATRYNLSVDRLKALNDADPTVKLELARAEVGVNQRILTVNTLNVAGQPQPVAPGETLEDFIGKNAIKVDDLIQQNPGPGAIDLQRAASATDDRLIRGVAELEIGGEAKSYTNETIDDAFLTRMGATLDQLTTLNDRIAPALQSCYQARMAVRKRLVKVDFIVVPVTVAVVLGPVVYDLTENNTSNWDWMVWETEGNSDPKYQRGGRERKLGLYSLNYHKLRCAGDQKWAPPHNDGTIGGGWIKIAILDQEDYGTHEELIKTFLPCFKPKGATFGQLSEDLVRERDGVVSRSPSNGSALNTLDSQPPLVVLPFNYDDNSKSSRAIGKDFKVQPLGNADVKRLDAELTRWATASRSTITAFPPVIPEHLQHAKQEWELRPDLPDNPHLPQVKGPPGKQTLLEYQADPNNSKTRYYSVKTGVDYVSTQSQKTNNKDLLESNSIHAMSRSNIIAGTIKKRTIGRFEGRYQLEILSILLGQEGSWDGIQVREIGEAGKDEVWFPALAIPSHGKAFAEAWKPGCDWIEFWEENFARPLGRAKAEMMAYFGLQHMTSNAQNFLVVFDRSSPQSKAKCVILRDIGDTILNTDFFRILKKIDRPLYEAAWKKEVADKENGIVLKQSRKELTIGGGYSNPQITRIGTGIVFFYPPFLKGDVNAEADPSKAKIVARWSVASNKGFFAYMKDKLAYDEDWSSGTDTVPHALKESIWKNADLSISGKSKEYAELADDVIGLSSNARLGLMNEIESVIAGLNPTTKDHVGVLQRLIAGHELLICAEIHSYVKGPFGEGALTYLHECGGRSATIACYQCKKTSSKSSSSGWYKCGTCGSKFCAACASKLRFRSGTTTNMFEVLVEERRCGNRSCTGSAWPREPRDQ